MEVETDIIVGSSYIGRQCSQTKRECAGQKCTAGRKNKRTAASGAYEKKMRPARISREPWQWIADM